MSMTMKLQPVLEAELAEVRAKDDFPDGWGGDEYMGADFYLDKAWDVLHRLLSADGRGGRSWAAQAVLGGTPFGTGSGYGPPHTLTAAQVRLVAAELATISEMEILRRHATVDLSDCYCAGAWDTEELLERFRELRGGYQAAAAAGQAMVLFM